MPGADKEALTIEPWAAVIGLGTLVLVAGVALFTAREREHTGSLESVITPTAVGDMHFVQEPAGGTGPIGLEYQGHKLDMLGESKIRDAKMIQVGTDATGVYTVYRFEDEAGKKERLFMKVGVNEFMEVTGE
jgi:hypothetical protein